MEPEGCCVILRKNIGGNGGTAFGRRRGDAPHHMIFIWLAERGESCASLQSDTYIRDSEIKIILGNLLWIAFHLLSSAAERQTESRKGYWEYDVVGRVRGSCLVSG